MLTSPHHRRQALAGTSQTPVAIIAFDGFTDIDVFLHWDLLNRPRTHSKAGTATTYPTAALLLRGLGVQVVT